jgi:DNA-binding FadR family transcriptional regulator
VTPAAITALLFALVKALPAIGSFLTTLHTMAQSKRDQGIGYDQAVADGIAQAHQGLLDAIAARNAADAAAAAHPDDDSGFDDEFRRD